MNKFLIYEQTLCDCSLFFNGYFITNETLRVFDVQGSYILDLKEYPAAIYYLQDSRNNKSYKLIKK